jgi:2-polyprenyl-6-hydroxyphenyl methylase / 3-demethylubiquinone-9 3-methyltransferase
VAGTNNAIYDQLADTWWRENGFLNLLQSAMNPWRLPYFKRVLTNLEIDPERRCGLDLGCGGGLLTEEFAKLGYAMVGLDRSAESLATAAKHARGAGLSVHYHQGDAREIPFATDSFDLTLCCDTLEHIENWRDVIPEIARTLKPGGVLFYDTINRTVQSKIRNIKMAQEWSWTRHAPPDTHVWEMFITPAELHAALAQNGFSLHPIVGTAPKFNPFQALWLTRKYKLGHISAAEFGRRVGMREGKILTGSYMGYALKEIPAIPL